MNPPACFKQSWFIGVAIAFAAAVGVPSGLRAQPYGPEFIPSSSGGGGGATALGTQKVASGAMSNLINSAQQAGHFSPGYDQQPLQPSTPLVPYEEGVQSDSHTSPTDGAALRREREQKAEKDAAASRAYKEAQEEARQNAAAKKELEEQEAAVRAPREEEQQQEERQRAADEGRTLRAKGFVDSVLKRSTSFLSIGGKGASLIPRAKVDQEGFLKESDLRPSSGKSPKSTTRSKSFIQIDTLPIEIKAKPDSSGRLPERAATTQERQEDRAIAMDARQEAENKRAQIRYDLDEARRMHDAARIKFQTSNDDWQQHPDIKGSPLSMADIRRIEALLLNFEPIPPEDQEKLDAIRAARELKKEGNAAKDQLKLNTEFKEGKGFNELIKTTKSILGVERP